MAQKKVYCNEHGFQCVLVVNVLESDRDTLHLRARCLVQRESGWTLRAMRVPHDGTLAALEVNGYGFFSESEGTVVWSNPHLQYRFDMALDTLDLGRIAKRAFQIERGLMRLSEQYGWPQRFPDVLARLAAVLQIRLILVPKFDGSLYPSGYPFEPWSFDGSLYPSGYPFEPWSEGHAISPIERLMANMETQMRELHGLQPVGVEA